MRLRRGRRRPGCRIFHIRHVADQYGRRLASHAGSAYDPTAIAAALLGELPANRTLGLRVTWAVGGEGRAELPVDEPVRNVIGTCTPAA